MACSVTTQHCYTLSLNASQNTGERLFLLLSYFLFYDLNSNDCNSLHFLKNTPLVFLSKTFKLFNLHTLGIIVFYQKCFKAKASKFSHPIYAFFYTWPLLIMSTYYCTIDQKKLLQKYPQTSQFFHITMNISVSWVKK